MHASWDKFVKGEWNKPYFLELSAFLKEAYATRAVYPPRNQVFSAFSTDLNRVKAVIIGQDPYHGEGQAHGLAFSVCDAVPVPRSLQNMFKEIREDTGAPIPGSGNLQRWADQGVLLLTTR